VITAGRADLTIVVPTYNERDRLGELVEAVFRETRQNGVNLELIVVDDNSPDGTGDLADALAQGRQMVVIRRSGKLGLGTAVVAGFSRASAPIVGVMDADFSHPPALVPILYRALLATQADVVVASRYVPGGTTPNWPTRRRLLSRAACLLARSLTPLRDAASGFFLIRTDLARGTTVKAGGFKICLELVVRGTPRRIVELPYRFDDREQGESKMSRAEAARYLVQLRDLVWLKMTRPSRPAAEYRQLSPSEVQILARGGAI
jgi:dolichol-phosphate mannosyltransferase